MRIYFIFLSIFLSLTAFCDVNDDLIKASQRGNIGLVRQAVEKGANINAKDEYGNTALMHAAQQDHKEMVTLLKRHGAVE